MINASTTVHIYDHAAHEAVTCDLLDPRVTIDHLDMMIEKKREELTAEAFSAYMEQMFRVVWNVIHTYNKQH